MVTKDITLLKKIHESIIIIITIIIFGGHPIIHVPSHLCGSILYSCNFGFSWHHICVYYEVIAH
jgi:hypothetical protein